MYVISTHTSFSATELTKTSDHAISFPDIIALLVVGVFLLVLFVLWEHYLERVHAQGGEVSQRWWTQPPLMPVSIWGRAKGKLAAMLLIAFVEWCSFNTFTFWVQVRICHMRPCEAELTLC